MLAIIALRFWCIRSLMVVGIGAAILGGFAWWVDDTMVDFSLLILAWPALTLSRFGISYTWLAALGVLLGAPALVLLVLRRRPWITVGLGGFILPVLYCVAAFWWVRLLPCPLPSHTPYDGIAEKRAGYLQSFRQGYLCGLTGVQRTYCFGPEAETAGFYAGSYRGLADFYRFLGRSMPHRQRRLLEVTAGRDGVSVDTKPTGANRSVERPGALPVGSEAP